MENEQVIYVMYVLYNKGNRSALLDEAKDKEWVVQVAGDYMTVTMPLSQEYEEDAMLLAGIDTDNGYVMKLMTEFRVVVKLTERIKKARERIMAYGSKIFDRYGTSIKDFNLIIDQQ